MKRICITIVIPLLLSCSQQHKQEHIESADANMTDTVEAVVVDTLIKPVEAPVIAPEPSDEHRFTSAQEAYDEGYYNGQQEGYTDATHHLEFGYNYNDEPEYDGYLKHYIQGYEDGYEDGYNEGLEWNSENE